MASDQHQNLMVGLSIINKRIAAQEAHLREIKGKVKQQKWEAQVRKLKRLVNEKEEIQRRIRRIK